MESKNNIDKLFKDKLGNREFEIKESFLADLEGKLDAQKPASKNKGIIFFLALIVIGGALTFYFINYGNETEKVNSELVLNTSAENLETETENTLDVASNLTIENDGNDSSMNATNSVNDSNLEENPIDSKNESDVSTSQSTSSYGVSAEETLSKEKESNQFASTSNGNLKTSSAINGLNNSNTNEGASSQSEEIEANFKEELLSEQKESGYSNIENTTEGNAISANSNQTTAGTKNNTSEETALMKDEVTDEESVVKNELFSDSASIDGNDIAETETVIDSALVDNEKDQINTDSVIQDTLHNENDLTDEVTDTNAIEKVLTDTTGTNSPKTTNAKRWTVSLFGGPSLANNNISGASSGFISRRDAGESNLLSASFGARVNYSFNEKVNLSIGVNTMNYGEKVDYSPLYSVSSFDSSYVETVYTPVQDTNGVWDTLISTVSVDTTIFDSISLDYTWKNKYSYLQIPIMIGYKFTFDKLSVNVRLGGSYGILLKSLGKYPAEDFNSIEPVTLKKTIFNFVASTTVSYRLNRMNVFIEPKYRLNSGSILQNTNYQQKYSGLGCNFGVSFQF